MLLHLHVYAQQKVVMPTPWTEAAMKASVPFPEYPRPQMERTEWMNLNGKWDYIGGKDASDVTATQPPSFSSATEKITVPYPPEAYLSGIQRNGEINMWYRKVVAIPA